MSSVTSTLMVSFLRVCSSLSASSSSSSLSSAALLPGRGGSAPSGSTLDPASTRMSGLRQRRRKRLAADRAELPPPTTRRSTSPRCLRRKEGRDSHRYATTLYPFFCSAGSLASMLGWAALSSVSSPSSGRPEARHSASSVKVARRSVGSCPPSVIISREGRSAASSAMILSRRVMAVRNSPATTLASLMAAYALRVRARAPRSSGGESINARHSSDNQFLDSRRSAATAAAATSGV
mmetsp:Transcript_7821/g.13461  ORF Transcript_7821/g.13461 Transcript_7821/m.13461 type:complete len:237 (-) Transcript_7821:234-944(-)